jgi:hypothetical protein
MALNSTERGKLEKLLKPFHLYELKGLAFDLCVDFELLSLSSVQDFVLKLVEYCEENGRLECLISEALKHQEDKEVTELLEKFPDCTPFTKIQITLMTKESELNEVSKLWGDLAQIFRVDKNEVVPIGATWGENIRLLIGIPASSIFLETLSNSHKLEGGKPHGAEAILFDCLDSKPQDIWRLAACNQPPTRKNNSLQLAASWKRVEEVLSFPSSQLYQDNISSEVERLLVSCRIFQLKCMWKQSEHCALYAKEICHNSMEKALVHIHLEDLYREVWVPKLAVEHGEQAYQILRRQPQRFNEAMAAYALGLVHEKPTFSDGTKALGWYKKALQGFTVSEEYWGRLDDKRQIERCHSIRTQIENKIRKILDRHAYQYEWRATFDIWHLDNAFAPFIKDTGVRGHIIGDQEAYRISINDTDYDFDRFPEINAEDMDYYFALPVDDRWENSEFRAFDYVFVRQPWRMKAQERPGQESSEKSDQNENLGSTGKERDRESVKVEGESVKGQGEQSSPDEELSEEQESRAGVIWEPGDGWLTFDFKRDKNGNIQFSPRPPHIVGGKDPTSKLKGYIVAGLREKSSASQSSGPSSTSPPQPLVSPSSGSSYDPKELYNELLSMVNGDKEVAQRLVDYEQERAPSADLSELIQRAIDRLIRDRR